MVTAGQRVRLLSMLYDSLDVKTSVTRYKESAVAFVSVGQRGGGAGGTAELGPYNKRSQGSAFSRAGATIQVIRAKLQIYLATVNN